MKIELTNFGGLLVCTESGSLAVNGGGTPEQMESAYLKQDSPLRGILQTSEHLHRSRNVAAFAKKHNIPVLLPNQSEQKIGPIAIQFIPIRYDSINPVALILSDGKAKIGIIPDGRLFESDVAKFSDCDELYFGNIHEDNPGRCAALRKRWKSVSNTKEEIERLFQHYNGRKFYYGIFRRT